MAVQLTSGRGIGLADMLIRQLSQGGTGAMRRRRGHGRHPTSRNRPPPRDPRTRPAASHRRAGRRHATPPLRRADAAACAHRCAAAGRRRTQSSSRRPRWKQGGAPRARRRVPATATTTSASRPAPSWHGERVASDTTEFTNGVAGTERAQFRAYGSVAENMSDYVRLLSDSPRYAAALNTGTDVRAFATALQRGGYATDPALRRQGGGGGGKAAISLM